MTVSTKDPLLILGGGLIGLALAYELAKKGIKVEVLSRNRKEAAGFVAAGMLAPHAEGLTKNLLHLGQLSLNRIPKWIENIEQDSGIQCGLKLCGIVVPFPNQTERDKYPTACFGKILNAKELSQEVPGIAKGWEAGLLFDQDGQIDNRRLLMRALEKACVELGVVFQEGVEVLNLIKQGQEFLGVKLKTAEGDVKDLKRNQAILCSGAWSSQILSEIPIFPVKGEMLSIQGPKDILKRVIYGPGTYLVPREDGLIVVGATSEQKAMFDEGLTPFGQRQLYKGIDSLMPLANEWPRMERWWGFRPCTPDKKPILGSSSLEGLWIATGHYRNGVLLAAITAELLTKKVLHEPLTQIEHELMISFHWNRFRKNT